MDFTGSRRLPNRVQISTMATTGTKSNQNEQKSTKNHSRRDQQDVEKRGNQISSKLFPTVYLNSVCSQQKDWRVQASLQLETTQQICENRAFQDGINSNDKTNDSTRCLDDHNRSSGR